MEPDAKRALSPSNASNSKPARGARVLVGLVFVAAVVGAPSLLRWSQGTPSFAGLTDTPGYAQLSRTKVQCTGVLGDSDLTEAVLEACFEPATHAIGKALEVPEEERTELDKQCRPWLGLRPGHPAANRTGFRADFQGGIGMLSMMSMRSSVISKCQLYMEYLRQAPFCSTNCAKALDSFFAVAHGACGGEALFVPQENSNVHQPSFSGPYRPSKAEQRRILKQMAFRQRIATADRHFRGLLELSNVGQLLRVLDFKELFDLKRDASCAVLADMHAASEEGLALNPATVPHIMLGGTVFEPPTMGPWGVNMSGPGMMSDYREGRSCSCFHNTSTITHGKTTINLTDSTSEERRVCVCWETPRFSPGNGTFFPGPMFANATRFAGAAVVGFPSPSHEPLTPVSEEVKKQHECAWHKKVLSIMVQDAEKMRPELLDKEILEIATAKTNVACDGVVSKTE